MPSLSLIIAYYNQVDNFELVLQSLELQSFKDFEVIIADDGSEPGDTDRLKQLLDQSGLNSKHIFHEDHGRAKSEIVNKAALEAEADYLIFIDADCILHPYCLEEHHRHKEDNTVIAGRRVDLSPALSARLKPEIIRAGWLWGRYRIPLLIDGLRNRTGHAENAIYFKSPLIRSWFNKKSDKGILGSHFSLYRNDFIKVNGYDERFDHWGGEDTDLDYRLRRNGVSVKTLKHIAIQYHIYHPRSSPNQHIFDILESNNRLGMTFTPFGIRKEGTT